MSRRTRLNPTAWPARVTKSVAGSSPITLSQAECCATVLELTGATQALAITIPSGQAFTLTNGTDYAHTVQRAGSTKLTTLGPSGSMRVQS